MTIERVLEAIVKVMRNTREDMKHRILRSDPAGRRHDSREEAELKDGTFWDCHPVYDVLLER